MIYCMSDIHGDYEKYRRMLEAISLREEDTLYILGDVVDRGPEPVQILLDMMQRPNVRPVLGNHEYMAVLCLRALVKEVTEETIAELSAETSINLFCVPVPYAAKDSPPCKDRLLSVVTVSVSPPDSCVHAARPTAHTEIRRASNAMMIFFIVNVLLPFVQV